MDMPTLLIRITGVALFGWTVRSLVKQIILVRSKESRENSEAVSEEILNSILFYVWLLFMFSFSIGMVINN